ncbi:hypothetical protein [Dethiothermospora halolimnae]|uniref:hypothetical protein n=1 Tax=Dethiothermospora halolimnae TaxID=3114390 RepID=UPI003CCC31CC
MSFSNIPPNAFSILASLLGIGIANNLDLNEQNSLGNFLEAVGQSILTVNGQEQLQQALEDKKKQNEQLKLQIEILQKQIQYLKGQIEE